MSKQKWTKEVEGKVSGNSYYFPPVIDGRMLEDIEGSPAFKDAVWEILELHAKKQKDYGTSADPFANVRASEEFGVEPWKGGLVRLNDKVTRLKNFALKGALANESVEDSLQDIAVYAIIALCLYREASRGRA
jgi:hypothetical protein